MDPLESLTDSVCTLLAGELKFEPGSSVTIFLHGKEYAYGEVTDFRVVCITPDSSLLVLRVGDVRFVARNWDAVEISPPGKRKQFYLS